MISATGRGHCAATKALGQKIEGFKNILRANKDIIDSVTMWLNRSKSSEGKEYTVFMNVLSDAILEKSFFSVWKREGNTVF